MMTATHDGPPRAERWDVVVVGASLAGCSTAIVLARAGLRVALVDRRPDPAAFKRVCGHFIQPSALPALERLGLLEPLRAAGAVGTKLAIRSPWGWIEQSPEAGLPDGLNLRREKMDPLVRRIATETPGVEPMLGWAADALRFDGGRVSGIRLRSRDGEERRIDAQLVVGADGRGSTIAELAGLRRRESAHGRFCYAAYYEDPRSNRDVSRVWLMDPQWGAEFPTDAGLTLYTCMPTMDRLPPFKRDLPAAFGEFVAAMPNPPPIAAARLRSPLFGKISMPNVSHRAAGNGVALVGDAALAVDPLAGVGCGWAFEGAVRLGDTVAPALLGVEPLGPALRRYRRRHRRDLAGHAYSICAYAGGQPFDRGERIFFSAATRDAQLADTLHAFGTRSIGLSRMVASALPRIVAASLPVRAGRAET
jgi:2-polyprenyl-6-methoxyphenol hydroxylase-like FAD-dependent oxidoreductase